MPLLQIVAMLCQVNSTNVELAQKSQAQCHAFYIECAAKAAYPFDVNATVNECILKRNSQVITKGSRPGSPKNI